LAEKLKVSWETRLSFYKNINQTWAESFCDMCRWPHVEKTMEIDENSFKLIRIAWAYWLWDEKNKQLTRIYAFAYDTKEELDTHLKMLEEAKRRDHRIIWAKLKLFTFSDLVWSGLPLFTPEWAFMRNAIETEIMSIQSKYWFQKVHIPHITKKDLYETSWHRNKYKDDLFHVRWKSDTEFVMKPMNCPHHSQIYASQSWSYRDLPIRYAETTTCYRDEQQWELLWLSRVRALTQDDWHIFCRIDQVWSEARNLVKVIREFYSKLGMFEEWKFYVSLSVRDSKDLSKYMWKEENWEKAESFLEEVAKSENLPYKRIEWEAAFYWPKLDFIFKDAIGREWQLATIQIDFVQPENFKLEFTNNEWQKERPVMIHRAIAWSLERFMSVIIEHFAWIFPLWLAPRQVIVVPVWEAFMDYAKKVEDRLKAEWIRVSADYSSDWLNKKVRNAEQKYINYILVVWEQEQTNNTVSIRNYKTKEQSVESLDLFAKNIVAEIEERRL
jgi:threonyl-tRNA synthetase